MPELKLPSIFERCKLKGVIGLDGKPHIEGVCDTKEDRDELATLFEEEAVLRVKPKLEPEPKPELVPEPKE